MRGGSRAANWVSFVLLHLWYPQDIHSEILIKQVDICIWSSGNGIRMQEDVHKGVINIAKIKRIGTGKGQGPSSRSSSIIKRGT